MLAGIFPAGPDGKYILSYQAFYIRRAFSMMQFQKILACLICDGIIYLIGILPPLLLDYDIACDDGAEVIEKKA